MNGSKDQILARIREALRSPAPVPGNHDYSHLEMTPSRPKPELESFRQWLPPVESNSENQWDLLTKSFHALKTDFGLLESKARLIDFIQELQRAEQWKRVGIHHGAMTDEIASYLEIEKLWVDEGYDPQAMEQCDVGISECDAIVAQTGSILITAKSAGGRGLSVLPPHHLVLARTSQIVADLPSAYELLYKRYGGNFPSMISFITGPSRTGDIERIVVLGAHGPKKLTVAILKD